MKISQKDFNLHSGHYVVEMAVQCSKGNNSKSRQTRVMVHVFCTLSQVKCFTFEWYQSYGADTSTCRNGYVQCSKGNNSKSGQTSYSSYVLHVVLWCFTFV